MTCRGRLFNSRQAWRGYATRVQVGEGRKQAFVHYPRFLNDAHPLIHRERLLYVVVVFCFVAVFLLYLYINVLKWYKHLLVSLSTALSSSAAHHFRFVWLWFNFWWRAVIKGTMYTGTIDTIASKALPRRTRRSPRSIVGATVG